MWGTVQVLAVREWVEYNGSYMIPLVKSYINVSFESPCLPVNGLHQKGRPQRALS